MDGFAVLAANIQDRVNRGIKIMGSPAMAGDLCDIFIRKINADAAVPRGDHKIQIFLRKFYPISVRFCNSKTEKPPAKTGG